MSHKRNDIWNETQVENGREDLCLKQPVEWKPTVRKYARGWKEQKDRDSIAKYELEVISFISNQFGL